VDAAQVHVIHDGRADDGAGAGHHVDDAGSTADEAGFHTTVFPIKAGLVGRLPAMEVKLNGVTAKTKPSNGRYSTCTREG